MNLKKTIEVVNIHTEEVMGKWLDDKETTNHWRGCDRYPNSKISITLRITQKGIEHAFVNLSIFMVYLVFDCYSLLLLDILIVVVDISCPKTWKWGETYSLRFCLLGLHSPEHIYLEDHMLLYGYSEFVQILWNYLGLFYGGIYLYRRIRDCNHSFYQKRRYLFAEAGSIWKQEEKEMVKSYPVDLTKGTILELYGRRLRGESAS